MGKYFRISSYIRKPFLIYDFASAPLWISLYMRKILFYFLSVYSVVKKPDPDVGKGGNAHLYKALKQGGAL
jgi:hypothetical protein